MAETSLHTSKSHHPQKWGPISLAVLAFGCYLLIALVRTYRGMNLLESNNNNNNHHHNLRSSNLYKEFFDSPLPFDKSLALHNIDPAIWDETLFSPLMQSFFPELQDMDRTTWMMQPTFNIKEQDGLVRLTTSIPDVPLEDIDIEVVGGRIIHIRGMKTTDTSHVSFDKRFSIGQKVDEAQLKARLSKDGVLEVSAPEFNVDEKESTRKIPVTLAEEL